MTRDLSDFFSDVSERLERASRLEASASMAEVLVALELEPGELADIDLQGMSLVDWRAEGVDLRSANLIGSDLSRCAFDAATLVDADLSGCELFEGRFRESDLHGTQLSRAKLGAAVFDGVNLAEACFQGAVGAAAAFEDCSLYRSNFTESTLESVAFNRSTLTEARFLRARLSHAVVKSCLIDRATFSDATLDAADLTEVRFERADFSGADLSRARINRVLAQEASPSDFSRVRLSEADIARSDLSGCTFSGASFSTAQVRQVSFDNADLTDADFSGATVSFCSFEGAELWQARFAGARLESVDLSRASGVASADFAGASLIQVSMHRSVARGLNLAFEATGAADVVRVVSVVERAPTRIARAALSLQPRPFWEGESRNRIAAQRRSTIPDYMNARAAIATVVNSDEQALASEGFAASFTKGLPHDEFGSLEDGDDYRAFVNAINQQDATDFANVPRGIGRTDGRVPEREARTARADGECIGWRGWESPRAGHYYDLQGPDSDALGMPPAPELGSEELIAEMGELYALALLRDVPFQCIADGSGRDELSGIGTVEVLDALSSLSWFSDTTGGALSLQERRRRAARRVDHGAALPVDAPPDDAAFDWSQAFRGSAPAVKAGPYVSQFMLLGNNRRAHDDVAGPNEDITDASIAYGAQMIDQKITSFPPHREFVLHWNAYVDVQNGADFGFATTRAGDQRFIATPRDLAAYVRFDALYQAYLNACLFMLGEGFAFQRPVAHPHTGKLGPGFPDRLAEPSDAPFSRQPFAAFGGPHALSLVTEVATRCLKAARRQEFNYHRRCRPERIGALLSVHGTAGDGGENDVSGTLGPMTRQALDLMASWHNLGPLLDLVERHNRARLEACLADPHLDFEMRPDAPWFAHARNYLLPMAYAEGSPMHPSYGAGHAIVAGGCVTMLKAFFDTVDAYGESRPWPAYLPVVQARADGAALERLDPDPGMTLGGELNKLAANISIGRNMAGVNYYTDYYESVRLGERIATGILIEQMMQYNEPVEMTFESFDGDHVHILKLDYDDADPRVFVHDALGHAIALDVWWRRHQIGFMAVEAPALAEAVQTADRSRVRRGGSETPAPATQAN